MAKWFDYAQISKNSVIQSPFRYCYFWKMQSKRKSIEK